MRGSVGFVEFAGVHAVGDYADIAASEILLELVSGALRDGGQCGPAIGIETAFERRQQSIVGATMQVAKRFWLRGVDGRFLEREFVEPVEYGVNDDDIGIPTIDAWRQDQVERETAENTMRPAKKVIGDHPTQKSYQVRTGNRGDFVPNQDSTLGGALCFAIGQSQILDALGVEVDFAVIVVCQALEKFRESAFGAVAAVDEGRNNGQPQVSGSRDGIEGRRRWRFGRPERVLEGETVFRGAARDTRSKRSPDKPAGLEK